MNKRGEDGKSKNHQQKVYSIEEQKVEHLTDHFRWSRSKADKVLHLAQKNNLIRMNDGLVELTEMGSSFTSGAMHYIITNKNLEPVNI